MRWSIALLVLWLLLSGLASASTDGTTLHLGRPQQTILTGVGSGFDNQDLIVCGLADLQNVTSSDDQIVVDGMPFDCRPNQAATNCSGDYCRKSPYCTGSWQGSGRLALRNLAYELTNQWGKIDWAPISGPDSQLYGLQNHPTQPLDHPRCDVIISYGDMNDISDGYVGQLLTKAQYCASSTENACNQFATTTDFWQTIKASGIPFLPLIGNHDPENYYIDLMTNGLNFSALPFYYAKSVSGREYAIKFSAAGRQFCVIGENSQSTLGNSYIPGDINISVHTRYATEAANPNSDVSFVRASIGCGANLPTILISHEIPYEILPGPNNMLDDPTFNELIAVGGGHYVPEFSTEAIATGTAGFQVFNNSGNWQELDEHGVGLNLPYGNTPSNSGGLYYTVTKLDFARNRVAMNVWSPYWQLNRIYPPNAAAGGSATNYKKTDFTPSPSLSSRFP